MNSSTFLWQVKCLPVVQSLVEQIHRIQPLAKLFILTYVTQASWIWPNPEGYVGLILVNIGIGDHQRCPRSLFKDRQWQTSSEHAVP